MPPADPTCEIGGFPASDSLDANASYKTLPAYLSLSFQVTVAVDMTNPIDRLGCGFRPQPDEVCLSFLKEVRKVGDLDFLLSYKAKNTSFFASTGEHRTLVESPAEESACSEISCYCNLLERDGLQ